MPKPFSMPTFFRMTPNVLLAEFFGRFATDVTSDDWDNIKERDDELLIDLLEDIKDESVKNHIEKTIHDIAALACKDGMAAFHEFALFCGKDRLECEANVYAAETLMDDNSVKQALRSHDTFYEVASELCVPPELLDFKCRTMKAKGIKVPESPIYAHSDFLKH